MPLKVFILLTLFGGWFLGLAGFYKSAQNFPVCKNRLDGIVVLTGGRERIQNGMALFKVTHAKRILISGVDRVVKESDIKHKQLKGYDDIHQFTDLGYGAVNTFSNALEAAFWARNNHFKVVGLVTSRFHIPRSFWLFKKAMPEIKIFPIAVDADDSSFFHLIKEYHKYYLTKFVSAFLFDSFDNDTANVVL